MGMHALARGGGLLSLVFCSVGRPKRPPSSRRGQSSMTPLAVTRRGCFRVPALRDAVRNLAIPSLAATMFSDADPASTRHMAAAALPDKVEELYFAPPVFTIAFLLSRGWMRATAGREVRPRRHDQK